MKAGDALLAAIARKQNGRREKPGSRLPAHHGALGGNDRIAANERQKQSSNPKKSGGK